MIRAGIIGGTGYTGGELIRLLLRHPSVDISFVQSKSQAGAPLWQVHPDLLGETALHFTEQWSEQVDVLFLCLPHGKSVVFLEQNKIPKPIKIIDLSRDFRLKSAEHDFVYGLPELNKAVIQNSDYIANCGCFATAIQLALLPLAAQGWLKNDIHIHAITGATGAGKTPVNTTHFSWRNNNISVYKAFRHQHLDEIKQSLVQLQNGAIPPLHFIPVRGDFPRGIFASIYTDVTASEDQIQQVYEAFYQATPFVWISPQSPDLKQVVNTNKCLLHLEKHEDKLLIISTLDNLLKGASGQAVQNMNLIFGLPEAEGLQLKAVAF